MQTVLELTDSQRQEEFFAQKSRFISHEIKNQLSVINLYTKLIEKSGEGDKSLTDSTKTIFNAVSSITNLLQELKSVSDLKMENCDLKNVVEEKLCDIEKMVTENNIRLETDFESVSKALINKQKFQNVVLNLIKNAVEALEETEREDRYIKISTLDAGEKILLRVENNGNKIDKKFQKSIFEEGFTTKKTGTGLGLCICKKTLNEQGCELNLLKSDCRQTVFQISVNKV